MKRRGVSELEAIELLRRVLSSRSPHVELGIGDDAAILSVGRQRLVWTVDTSQEDVHFDRRWLSMSEIGERAFEAAVSDLAAMGAEPLGALSALTLPRHVSEREIRELGRGQARAARRTGCPLIGGNISRGNELSITTSALGRAPRPLRRDGARPGDELWLVGPVGLARTGLELLRWGKPLVSAAERRAVAAWRRPKALLVEGRGLVGRARAALDVSDGLGGDAGHLSRASSVAVVVEATALRRALPRSLASAVARVGRDPLEQALAGGEDYALLATGPAKARPAFARCIGRVERGEGVWLEAPDGTRRALGPGFDHLG
jgi:thiamine-monophosphate kinase